MVFHFRNLCAFNIYCMFYIKKIIVDLQKVSVESK